MGRTLIKSLACSFVCCAGVAVPSLSAELEAGAAITDPAVLAELEKPQPGSPGFRIDVLLAPSRGSATPMKNDNLFRGVLSPVARSLTNAIQTLPERSLDSAVRDEFKKPDSADLRFNPKIHCRFAIELPIGWRHQSDGQGL